MVSACFCVELRRRKSAVALLVIAEHGSRDTILSLRFFQIFVDDILIQRMDAGLPLLIGMHDGDMRALVGFASSVC